MVLVVLRDWFMYLWRISKPRRTTVYMYKNQDNRGGGGIVVLVVLRDWFMYLWRISQPWRTTVYMYKNQDNRKSHEKYQP